MRETATGPPGEGSVDRRVHMEHEGGGGGGVGGGGGTTPTI